MSILDLKKDLKDKKPIFGAGRALKLLRNGELEKIYLSSNVREDIKKDILHYAKLSKVKIIELMEDNSQLGVICKKKFNIGVISF